MLMIFSGQRWIQDEEEAESKQACCAGEAEKPGQEEAGQLDALFCACVQYCMSAPLQHWTGSCGGVEHHLSSLLD